MPLTHGSVSLREFCVEGDVAPHWAREAETALRRHAFRPIAVEKGETRSMGWVNPRQILDPEVTVDKIRMGPWVLLALRQDRMALNARLFRAQRELALAEAAHKAKKTRLSKTERQVVEEKVKLDMLRRQTPSTSIIEGAWHPDAAVAYVAASSESAATAFMELFATTFGLTLTPTVAGLRVLKWAESNGLSDRMAELAPTAFSAKAKGAPAAAPVH